MNKIFPKDPARRYRIVELRMKSVMRKHVDIVAKSVLKNVRLNLNNRILRRRTSRLYTSFKSKVSAIRGGYRITVGSPVVYAKIHDTGGMAGRNRSVRIPKRNYFRLAFIMSKGVIRRSLKNYLAEVFR